MSGAATQLFVRAASVTIGLSYHIFQLLHSESETSTSLARATCGVKACTSSLATSHPFLLDQTAPTFLSFSCITIPIFQFCSVSSHSLKSRQQPVFSSSHYEFLTHNFIYNRVVTFQTSQQHHSTICFLLSPSLPFWHPSRSPSLLRALILTYVRMWSPSFPSVC